MTTSEKVAYLKGLAEGMGIQEDGGQGKLFHVIIDILEDLSLDLADTKDALVDLTDSVEEISDDLAELENEFYESPCSCCGSDDDEDEEYDDEDDTVFYSVECPGCGFKLTVDEDTLDAGSFECPECGEVIDFENAAVEFFHRIEFFVPTVEISHERNAVRRRRPHTENSTAFSVPFYQMRA